MRLEYLMRTTTGALLRSNKTIRVLWEWCILMLSWLTSAKLMYSVRTVTGDHKSFFVFFKCCGCKFLSINMLNTFGSVRAFWAVQTRFFSANRVSALERVGKSIPRFISMLLSANKKSLLEKSNPSQLILKRETCYDHTVGYQRRAINFLSTNISFWDCLNRILDAGCPVPSSLYTGLRRWHGGRQNCCVIVLSVQSKTGDIAPVFTDSVGRACCAGTCSQGEVSISLLLTTLHLVLLPIFFIGGWAREKGCNQYWFGEYYGIGLA